MRGFPFPWPRLVLLTFYLVAVWLVSRDTIYLSRRSQAAFIQNVFMGLPWSEGAMRSSFSCHQAGMDRSGNQSGNENFGVPLNPKRTTNLHTPTMVASSVLLEANVKFGRENGKIREFLRRIVNE
jgi:hypothetical protein